MAWQGRGRYRNMYYLTGLPGCVRFGYSPGWRTGGYHGLSPCAQYLAETGQFKPTVKPWITPILQSITDPQQRLQFLKISYEALKTQLEDLKKEIDKLESASEENSQS
ncbi:MAG: hypothetical protein OdinLCB4_006765 [Candidatus Odinarchaeum yellowstonii]|uniref:Uncharacterized protein n=1 Tax=Odinarchaeota yellowstonii (strain LCB_4) TaxID=1841599 RepID=A0AAF0IBP5_ODILC|nr:MAG: hypothetical protein OdinLCB4_006765 [Candidatus Odinarchaeum yellowstonii]